LHRHIRSTERNNVINELSPFEIGIAMTDEIVDACARSRDTAIEATEISIVRSEREQVLDLLNSERSHPMRLPPKASHMCWALDTDNPLSFAICEPP